MEQELLWDVQVEEWAHPSGAPLDWQTSVWRWSVFHSGAWLDVMMGEDENLPPSVVKLRCFEWLG